MDGPTCGQGLAEHSSLPARLGELTAAEPELLALLQERLRQDQELLAGMRQGG